MPEKNETQTYRIVPEPTLRRLPRYLNILHRIRFGGREVISTSHIAEELKLDPTQVRKDLAYTGISGRPKVGYVIDELIVALESFLGWRNTEDAFLVGAGALGTALLGHKRLEECGLRIVAAFDRDPAKIGTTIHDKDVLPMKKLTSLASRMHILIGVLTIPAEGAQEAADRLIEGGVKAIWNFAPMRLAVPDSVVVVDGELYSTLGMLKHGLAQALKNKE